MRGHASFPKDAFSASSFTLGQQKLKNGRRKETRKPKSRIFTLLEIMPQLSSPVIFVSIVSLASLVICRPTDQNSFDLREEEKNFLTPPDLSLSPSDEATEESLPLPESVVGSTEPLLPTSFSGPLSTAFVLDSDLDPISPPFTFQIADWTLCQEENRYAFCCKGEQCVKTAKCYSDEDLNCCTVNPGDNADKTPYNCQPPSAPSLQSSQNIPQSFSTFFSELPNDFDSHLVEDFFSSLPGDSPVDTFQEPETVF